MAGDGYVLWFIVMAVAITAILALGTLGAAGVLHLPHHARAHAGTRHHWYDRFHHA